MAEVDGSLSANTEDLVCLDDERILIGKPIKGGGTFIVCLCFFDPLFCSSGGPKTLNCSMEPSAFEGLRALHGTCPGTLVWGSRVVLV